MLGRDFNRRGLLLAGFAALGLAACDNSVDSNGAATMDAAADQALNYLYGTEPATRQFGSQAAGILIIPEVTQGGLGLGGSFGRGVLRIGDVSVDYYSATQASIGFQIGVQQYSQVLFFMTNEALADFRSSSGWTAGAGVRYTVQEDALNVGVDSTRILNPVEAVVFAQSGVIAGATLDGTKYTRIIP